MITLTVLILRMTVRRIAFGRDWNEISRNGQTFLD